jgi:FtsH-binding integral membrane protein
VKGGLKMNKEAIKMQNIDKTSIEDGLQAYMLRVYNYMASGLVLTSIVAYGVSRSETAVYAIFGTPLFWVILFAPIAIVLLLSSRINDMKADTAQAIFWVYSVLLGLSMASVFISYTGESIAKVFLVTAGMFATMSLYGFVTKKDLSGFGTFLFMGLVGVIGALLVNIFLKSSAIHFVTSLVGVLVFVGLTAYDTHEIKKLYLASDTEEVRRKKAILGALHLYLNFVNLFLHLLALFGNE